jgi:hypothetical protein
MPDKSVPKGKPSLKLERKALLKKGKKTEASRVFNATSVATAAAVQTQPARRKKRSEQ